MACSSSSGAGISYPLELADQLPLQFEIGESSSSEVAGEERKLHLDISVSRYIANELDGVRVRIEADDAINVTLKVFAYVTLPMNPQTGERTAMFSHICSPSDLEEYPADAPLPGITPEWLRLPYVDVILRSWDEAVDLITRVKADVKALIATLNTMDTLQSHEAVWITD